ncbi:MAG: transcriptional repressor [Tannerella sp.]|nr:transcriptional repressor [Tannerella sp.]
MSHNLHGGIDKMREIFTRYMTEKGLRKTMERYTILECVCRIGGHFDVEMLRSRLEDDNFHVSRSSVYNTLELLLNANLIVRHQFSAQQVEYELKNAAATHHHVICDYCGRIGEVKNDKVKINADYRIPRFTQEYHILYIYGMCSKCKFRLMKASKKK